MSKRLLIEDSEYLDKSDYNRLGLYPQQALDGVVGAAIGYPAHWSAFTVSQKSAQEVTVSPGKYLENSIVYSRDESVDINLTVYFPLAASDEKWIALIARGETETLNENRSFETSEDPEISEPVEISTPKVESRVVNVVIQQGSPTPAPATKPEIAGTDACIAFVKVTTSGIQEIVPGTEWRVKTLFEVEGRLTGVELKVDQLFEDTQSLRTDLGNAAADIYDLRQAIPDGRVFAQIVRDTARHGQALNMPEEARNYWFDQALIHSEPDTAWDFQAGGYFRIDEGIRFQYVAQFDHQLRLQSYDDPAISVWDNRLVLPAYSEVARITSPEGSGRKDIANTVHTVTTAVRRTKRHTRIRYGETVTVCENAAGWENLRGKKAGESFKAGGEEWVSRGRADTNWNRTGGFEGHYDRTAQKVIRESYTSTYVTYNTEEFGLSGAVHGQTFLCQQVFVATSVDLNFTRVGPTGDVLLSICEVDGSSAPNYEAVLATVNVARDDLVNGWNKFEFEPTLLDQGKRYAWFVTTTGNHQLMTNSGNSFVGGTLFISTDGAWSQGTITEDFTFRLNGAKFERSRTVLPVQPLTLEGGMTEIDMIYKAWETGAATITWEVRAPSMGPNAPWIPMDDRENNPLANLPPLIELRAVMTGTEDVAPAIDLDQYARAIAGRMRLDMRAISKLRTFGFPTAEAQIVLNMDNYDAAKHTAVPKMVLADNTVVDATSIIETVDPSKPTRTMFVANFDLPAGTTEARARVDATTDSVIDVPFGQDIQGNWF